MHWAQLDRAISRELQLTFMFYEIDPRGKNFNLSEMVFFKLIIIEVGHR